MLASEAESDPYVAFASHAQGKLFRKQILRPNETFRHPANPSQTLTITPSMARQMVANFKANKSMVQFPMVDSNNRHVESPDANLGEVLDLTYDDKNGLVATIDVRKHQEDIGKTIIGASAMFSLNHTDPDTGEKIGPTLYHVAATNRPHRLGLQPYEPVSLSNSENDDNTYIVMLSEGDAKESGSESDDDLESENSSMDRLEELLAELRDTFDIDVESLQKAQKEAAEAKTAEEEAKAEEKVEEAEAKVEKTEEKVEDAKAAKVKEPVAASAVSEEVDSLVAALSDALKSAKPDLVALSASEVSISDVANAVIELSAGYSKLEGTVAELNRSKAEADVDEAVRSGKIFPAQRDAMVELKLSDSDMYDRLIPETAIVAMSAEKGIAVNDMGNAGTAIDETQAEIERITAKLKNRK